jgi:outer membrane protein TolC
MKLTFIQLLLLSTFGASAQHNILGDYINQAMKNNQGLNTQQIGLSKSLYALKEAHSLFLPNISFGASYSKAEGGRSIDIPVGDLLNPVYKSLNQLTSSGSFPQLQNYSVQLNPDNYYDARVHTTVPLIDAEIYFNQKIKKENITQHQAAVNIYKRELVKDVKIAYYQYYQADQSVSVYGNALVLVNENIRVNQSLLKNGVRNSTALTRSETEKQKIQSALEQSLNNRKNSLAYFNFLLNRSLETTIILDSSLFAEVDRQQSVSPQSSASGREELAELQSSIRTNDWNKKLERAYLLPKLSSFLDLGSQGFDFQYNNKTQYYLWGISLQWNLFAGGQHKYRVQQASLGMESMISQYKETFNTFQLQLVQSLNNQQTALSDYKNAQTQLALSEKYYEDQFKLYKAGELLYLELLDALTQLTNARLQVAVTLANVKVAGAETERNEASYPIQN